MNKLFFDYRLIDWHIIFIVKV